MNRSSEYGFYLPQNTDPISVNDFNYNFDVIDDNMLSKNEQTLTSAQKSQVKENLGFADQADLDALSSKIEICQLNESVDLNSYTAGNLYRFTTDGYLSVDSSSGSVIFRLYSYSNGRYVYNSIENQSISVFVKKGMQVDIRAKTGTPNIKFYPMTSLQV